MSEVKDHHTVIAFTYEGSNVEAFIDALREGRRSIRCVRISHEPRVMRMTVEASYRATRPSGAVSWLLTYTANKVGLAVSEFTCVGEWSEGCSVSEES